MATRRAAGPTRRAPVGLTLIELLVTLLVLGILSVMGFRALQTMTETQFRLSDRADFQRREAVFWRFIERDLEPLQFVGRQALQANVVRLESGFQLPRAVWRLDAEGLTRIDAQGNPLLLVPGVQRLSLRVLSGRSPPVLLKPGEPWSVPLGPLGLEIEVETAALGTLRHRFALGPQAETQLR